MKETKGDENAKCKLKDVPHQALIHLLLAEIPTAISLARCPTIPTSHIQQQDISVIDTSAFIPLHGSFLHTPFRQLTVEPKAALVIKPVANHPRENKTKKKSAISTFSNPCFAVSDKENDSFRLLPSTLTAEAFDSLAVFMSPLPNPRNCCISSNSCRSISSSPAVLSKCILSFAYICLVLSSDFFKTRQYMSSK